MYNTNKMLALQVRTKIAFVMMIDRIKSSERGQTAVEYAGIAFVVAMIALFLIGKQSEIGEKIVGKIGEAIDKITG